MINEIIVIDNVISKTYQDKIEQELVFSKEFPWYYVPNITHANFNLAKDGDGLAHLFWDHLEGGSISKITNLLLPLLYESIDRIDFKMDTLTHGRVFQTFPTVKSAGTVNQLHVDEFFPHLVVLYYVSDADGDTLITEATADKVRPDLINEVSPGPAVIKQVTPKKGRVVMFDGRHYHASTNPTQHRRCIINFDVTEAEQEVTYLQDHS